MQRRRFHWVVVAILAMGFALSGSPNAWATHEVKPAPSPAAIGPITFGTWALAPEDRVLMDALRGGDRSASELLAPAWPHMQSSRLSSLRAEAPPARRERLDFGRIGGVALISREVDQYGRVRGVDFLTFDDPASRWDMKLSVKHGAMLQITRHWGGGGSGPFSDRAKSSLVSNNR